MENNKSPLTPYLPFELVTQILLRLPVKSLICFKCVCKSWFSLISHPKFANSQFHLSQLSQTQTRRILYISSVHNHIRSIDFESSLIHESTPLKLNLLPQSYSYLEIKGSCRGFLFFRYFSTFILWNPSTGFHRSIPFSRFRSNVSDYGDFNHLYGFGYDHSRDDYLLVLLSYKYCGYNNLTSHLEFFSMRDNTWTEIERPHFPYRIRRCYGNHYHSHRVGTFFNGAIHWLVYRRDLMVRGNVIVVFDLMGRKLLDMPFPHNLSHARRKFDLLVSGEFLSLCATEFNPEDCKTKFEMWVMKDYKLHSSWTKILDFFIDHSTPDFFPICFTKSGDIIGGNGDVGMVKYNDKGQRLEYRNYYSNNLVGRESAVYTESLLSLPGNCEQV